MAARWRQSENPRKTPTIPGKRSGRACALDRVSRLGSALSVIRRPHAVPRNSANLRDLPTKIIAEHPYEHGAAHPIRTPQIRPMFGDEMARVAPCEVLEDKAVDPLATRSTYGPPQVEADRCGCKESARTKLVRGEVEIRLFTPRVARIPRIEGDAVEQVSSDERDGMYEGSGDRTLGARREIGVHRRQIEDVRCVARPRWWIDQQLARKLPWHSRRHQSAGNNRCAELARLTQ